MKHKLILLLLLTLMQYVAVAQMIWYVMQEGAGMKTGKNWSNAADNLQAIIDSANQGDEIWIGAGMYLPSATHNGGWINHQTFFINKDIKLFGGFKGIESEISQRDWVLNPTILSGDLNGDDVLGLSGEDLVNHPSRSDNAFHVVWLEQVSNFMVLSGFIIESGHAGHPVAEDGGGIYISGSGNGNASNPSIDHCNFQQNSAIYRGGAIFNNGEEGGMANMRVVDCGFFENYAGFQGGAIFNAGASNGVSSPNFLNCTFRKQKAEFDGGAIYNSGLAGTSNPVFNLCVFENNAAGLAGGAVMNFGHSGSANPIFMDCIFSGNSSMHGGAIHNAGVENGQSNPQLTACVFESNTAESYGGAVYNDGQEGIANAIFLSCRFTSNSTSFQGGAMFNNGDDGTSSPTIKSCFFKTNYAASAGGAIFNQADRGTSSPMIDSSVFTANHASGGGGAICNFSSTLGIVNPVVTQCLFSQNLAESTVGGAIWDNAIGGICNPTYSDCVFARNQAGQGGAVKSIGKGASTNYNPTFLNCTFNQNSASTFGGAIFYNWNDEHYPRLINCSFWDNTAEEGGAIYGFSKPSAHPRFINCSFSNNTASTYGGAMNNRTCDGCATPDLLIKNCIFWDNHAVTGKSMYNSWATPQLFYTLIQETNCPSGAYCHTPSMLYNQDPLFQDQNGNMRLHLASAARNTGENAALPNSVLYDLDNNARIMGSAVDRGAFEFVESVGVELVPVYPLPSDLQIKPNPFIEQTEIGFILAEASHIRLRVKDFSGRTLMIMDKDYQAGYHSEVFKPVSSAFTEILFCEIITPSGSVGRTLIQTAHQ